MKIIHKAHCNMTVKQPVHANTATTYTESHCTLSVSDIAAGETVQVCNLCTLLVSCQLNFFLRIDDGGLQGSFLKTCSC